MRFVHERHRVLQDHGRPTESFPCVRGNCPLEMSKVLGAAAAERQLGAPIAIEPLRLIEVYRQAKDPSLAAVIDVVATKGFAFGR